MAPLPGGVFAVEALIHGLAKRYRARALGTLTGLDEHLDARVTERLVWDEERMPLAGSLRLLHGVKPIRQRG